jgi:tetratricopeptide (TPR) repeat protein
MSKLRFGFLIVALALSASVAQAQAGAPAAPASAEAGDAAAKQQAATLTAQAQSALDARQYKDARKKAADAVKLDGDNVDARYVYGMAALRTGQFKTARAQLAVVRQRDAGRAGVARALGEASENLQENKRAAQYYLAAAAEEKSSELSLKAGRLAFDANEFKLSADGFKGGGELGADDLGKYAKAAEKTERWPEAVASYAALLGKTNDAALRIPYAKALVKTNDLDGAQKTVDQLLQGDPKNGDALLLGSDIAHARGDAATEEKMIRDAIAAQPNHPSANRRLGELALARKDYDAAKTAFQAQLAITPDDWASHGGLARISMAQGDVQGAIEHGKQAVASPANANDPAANALLGHAYYFAGDCKSAVGPLRLGAKLGDDEELLDLAECLHNTGSDAGALDYVAKVQAKDKAQPRSHEVSGLVALGKRQMVLAKSEFGIALTAHKDDPDFLVKLARAYAGINDTGSAASLLDQALKMKPGHVEASRVRANLYVQKGEFDKALPLLETVDKAHPGEPEILSALAMAHRAAAKGVPGPELDKADNYAQQAIKAKPENPEANEATGLVLLDRAAPVPPTGGAKATPGPEAAAALDAARKSALPFFEKALGGKPGHEALAVLASAKRAAGDSKGAAELLSRVQEKPAPEDVVTVQAGLLLDARKLKDADAAIQPVLISHPGNGEAQLIAADVAAAQGQAKEARSHYQAAAALVPFTAPQHARYAAALAGDGAFDQAKIEAQTAIQSGDDEGSVHATLGWALYKTGDAAGSKAELDAALQKGAADKMTRIVLGEIALDGGKKEEALGHFKEALKIDPNDATANGAVGRALVEQKKFAEALPLLKKSWIANNQDPAVGAALAKTYLAVGNATTDAQAVLDALPEGTLDEGTAHTLRGQIATQRGNYLVAAKEYDAALKAKPGDADILQIQAQNYLKLPQYDKAIGALEQAQKAAPNRSDVAQQLARLYAETDQKDKAAEAQSRADVAESTEREAARKDIPADQIKTVAVSEEFKAMAGGSADFAYVGKVLPDAISHDLAKSPYIQLLARDARSQEAMDKQKEAWATEHPDASPEDVEKAVGGLATSAPYVVDGQYTVIPGGPGEDAQLQVTAKLVEVAGQKIIRSSARNGGLKDFSKIQHAVALELLGQFVPINEKERSQIEDAIPTGSLESMRLISAAQDARRKGDLRGATALLRQARAADAGNVAAISELKETQKALGTKNRVAIRDFTKIGTAPEYVEAGLQNTITSKLANIDGIQVVERGELPAIEKEMEVWAAQHADAQDTASAADIARMKEEEEKMKAALPVGAVVSGSYQLSNGVLVIDAKMIDWDTKADMLAERVSGSEKNLLDLENELAEKIARRLVGAPSEEEMKRLREKQDFEAYKHDMEELARRRTEDDKKQEAKATAELAQAGLPAADAKDLAVGTESPADEDSDEPDRRKGDTLWTKWRLQGIGQKNGGPMLGLDLGIYTATSRIRDVTLHMSWIFGAASNRLTTARNGDYAPVALYDTGFDFDFDYTWKWIGFDVGAAATLGAAQRLALGKTGETVNEFFFGIRPRAGVLFQFGALQLSGDLGYQIGFGPKTPENGASVNGFSLGLGVAYHFGEDVKVPSGFEVAYQFHPVIPAGENAFKNYGKVGLLPEHLIFLQGGRYSTQGLVIGFGDAAYNNNPAGKHFSMFELGWNWEYLLFDQRHRVMPVVGARLSLVRYAGEGLGTDGSDNCASSSLGCFGILFAPHIGLRFNIIWGLNIDTSIGRDFVWSGLSGLINPQKKTDPSGYSANVGASWRF